MNIFDAYVSDRPSCFYKIDEYGTSFPNLAGDSRALISSVASDKSSNTPIVRGSDGPVLVGGSKTLKIPSDRLSPGTKNAPVTLECWTVPRLVGPPTEQITSVTNLVINPSGRSTSGTVTVRENLAANPNFELSADKWTVRWYGAGGGAGTVSRTAAAAHSGGFGWRKTWTTAPSSADDTGFSFGADASHPLPVTAGSIYSAGAYLRASIDTSVTAFIEFYDANDTKVFMPNGDNKAKTQAIVAPAGQWVRPFIQNVLVPAGAVYAVASFGPASYGGGAPFTNWQVGDTLDIDDLTIEKSSVLGPHFDGSTPAAGDFTYAWSGTPNASTSKQLAIAPSGYANRSNVSATRPIYVSWDVSPDWNQTSLKVESKSNTVSLQASLGFLDGQLSLSASTTYSLLVWLYVPADSLSAQWAPRVIGVNGTPVTVADQWVMKKVLFNTGAAPNGVIHLAINTSSVTVGQRCYVGGSIIVEGDYAGDYFDGETAQTNNVRYSWDGAPDGSTSTSYAPGPVEIMSHQGTGDGISFDGDCIKFTVNFESADPAQVKWFVPDYLARYHVVGVYSTQKLSLYINGFIVGEVDLTTEQLLDSLAPVAENTFCIGSSDTYETLLIDAPAIYNHPLSSDQIASHYLAGSDVRDAMDNVISFGGKLFTFDDNERNVLLVHELDTSSGEFVDTTNRDGIRPAVDDSGESISGTWKNSIPVAVTGDTSLAGVKLDWNGDGYYTVEASLDLGSSWVAVDNGRLIPGTEGLDTTGKEIDVRVTFQGGITDDNSVIRNITATAYDDYIVRSDNSNRTVLLDSTATTASVESAPIESYQNAGVRLNRVSAVVNADDSDDPHDTKTIELWLRLNELTSGSITDALFWDGTEFDLTGGTLYINGDAGPVTPGQNEWIHLVMVMDASFNSNITIGSSVNIQVGLLALYEAALDAGQVSRLYQSYFGSPIASVVETGAITVQEASEAYRLYDYNWQIVSGGR